MQVGASAVINAACHSVHTCQDVPEKAAASGEAAHVQKIVEAWAALVHLLYTLGEEAVHAACAMAGVPCIAGVGDGATLEVAAAAPSTRLAAAHSVNEAAVEQEQELPVASAV